MKTKWVFSIYSCVLLILFGCAFGRKVPYEKMKIDLTYSGTKSLAIAVYDQREMVVDGSRKPDFVGYTRSGVGIAYPMSTQSGIALATVIQEVVSNSYKAKGYSVHGIPASFSDKYDDIKARLVQSSGDRLILIKLKKLHTDFYAATMCIYDIDVEVFDKSGNLLVVRNFQKEQKIGGNAWGTGDYQKYTPEYIGKELASWLNDPQIVDQLK